MCDRKQDSLKPRPIRQPDGVVTDARPIIPLTVISHETPKVCQQQSVTVQPEDHAKYRQNLLFGTQAHTDVMNMLRQSQESLHGVGKDHAHEALGSSGKRRVRGKAPQALFAAFLLAAMNVRKIHTFLAEATEDPTTGAIYRYRRPRKGDHARTGVPPGIPPEKVLGHPRNPQTQGRADQDLVTAMTVEAEAIALEAEQQRQRGRPRRHLP